jgi:acyl-CoA synthetase (NDP forming)
VPLTVVVLNQPEAVRTLDTRRGKVPAYAYPEAAARALARAARYAQWRSAPRAAVPALADVDAERGREIVRAFLAARPDGGWLPPAEAVALLGCFGLPLAPAAEARADDGLVAIGVTDDQMFGPLVVLGPAGPAPDPPVGQAARLAPLTSADADTLISSIRSLPLAQSHPGAPGRSLAAADAALRDALLRVSRLTDDLPEIAELDLNPVIARPEGVVVVNARVRVAPQVPEDPFLRKLR